MPRKVTWKKGMRLSTDVFKALEHTIEENVRLSCLVASGGRYGLFTTTSPFELTVNISNNMLEVVSMNCHGITKSGRLIDVEFDSNYHSTFDTRIPIPSTSEEECFLLVIRMHEESREINEMYSETKYSFELIGEHSPIHHDTLPVGRIVNEYGWRLDETEFVPPSLYVSAHQRYIEVAERVKHQYNSISDRCQKAGNCVAKIVLTSVWNRVLSEYIELDKRRDSLTPEGVLASIQRVVASFVTGCTVDEHVSLENAEPFTEFVRRSYDARKIYMDIVEGLGLCADIQVKMDTVCNMVEIKEPPAEKTKTAAPVASEPKKTGRNRWEGLEI